mgnify:CR=1 FL=1
MERFFAEITTRRIRRGSYASVDELETAIYDYLLQHNTKPKPFHWTKTAEDILTRERRALNALDEIRGNGRLLAFAAAGADVGICARTQSSLDGAVAAVERARRAIPANAAWKRGASSARSRA